MASQPTDSQAKSAPKLSPGATVKTSNEVVVRETVESLAVAFILALLFKAFVAEAFVIPTGSMAPTLMGAHKDITSEETGFRFQVGASSEFDNDLGQKIDKFIVAGICPISRKPQVINPLRDKNENTFSGDRILVSKLAYVWSIPKRWDVIVFKFIERARQNYIKRCIGLPNETVRIFGGDIYVRPSATASFEIARKPPHIISAMMQTVNDSEYVPKSFVKGNVPPPWQPLEQDEAFWQSDWSTGQWSAKGEQPTEQTAWLRYFHRVIDVHAWRTLEENGALAVPLDPRQPRLITDFTAYNTGVELSINPNKFDSPEAWNARVESEMEAKYRVGSLGFNDGTHWTGDLALEVDFDTSSGTKSVSFLIVEYGFKHIITVDLSSGQATAQVFKEDESIPVFGDSRSPIKEIIASTKIRAGRKHKVRFSNIDEQLTLWVDYQVVAWTPTNKLNISSYVPQEEQGPVSSAADPLDGAPLGIGVAGGSMTVSRVKVFRDIYHIAYRPGLGRNSITDYETYEQTLNKSITAEMREEYARKLHGLSDRELSSKIPKIDLERHVFASTPNAWIKSEMITKRKKYDFPLLEDQFFPMGDNSAASSDARSWSDHHTPQRLMIGRAVVLFWPHYWNAPVPFFPNFQRMGLIR
ncbi:signal peptidase I [Pirellulaceae bacterium SH449]